MWSVNRDRRPALRALLKALGMGLGLMVCATPQAQAQNLRHPPALDIFARPDAIASPVLSSDANHAYYLSRKARMTSLIDHDLISKAKVEIPLTGPALAAIAITPIDAHHVLVSYPDQGTRMAGSVVNTDTRSVTPLLDDTRPIDFRRVSLYQGTNGPVLTLVDQTSAVDSIRFDYDPSTGMTSRTGLEPGVSDLWLSPTGEPQFAETINNDAWSLKGYTAGAWHNLINLSDAQILGRGRTPDSLFLKKRDNGGIVEIRPDGTITDIDAGSLSRTRPLYSSAGGRALGLAYTDDWVRYEFTDPEAATLPALADGAFAFYRVTFIDYASDARRCIIRTEGEDDAGTYYFVDFAHDEYVELGKTRPALHEEWIAEKEAFSFHAADGTEIKAYLTLPPGREPHGLPVAVIVPDKPGPEPGLAFDPVVVALATRGYAVLQPMAREGKPGDLMDAVAYLKANDIVDDKRLCLMGKGLKHDEDMCVIDTTALVASAAEPDARLPALKAMVDILTKENAPY